MTFTLVYLYKEKNCHIGPNKAKLGDQDKKYKQYKQRNTKVPLKLNLIAKLKKPEVKHTSGHNLRSSTTSEQHQNIRTSEHNQKFWTQLLNIELFFNTIP